MTVAATVSLEMACRRSWDVIVVGSGPAGALAAKELAERKQAVLLVDRAAFPRWKVCGCCVNAHALAILREAGVYASMIHRGALALQAIHLATAGHGAQIPLSGGVALSREALDAELVRAAIQAGAVFLPQTSASLPRDSLQHDHRRLYLQQAQTSRQATARIVVAADGLGGKLLARTGVRQATTISQARIGAGVVAPDAPAYYSPGVIFMACGRPGYLGAVRLEDGRLNLAAAFDPRWVRDCGGIGSAAVQLLAEVGWPAVPTLAELGWRGTPTLTRMAQRRAAERLFLLGDAAGYIEPFTGEGIAWALAAGKMVAPLAVQSVNGWQPDMTRQWEITYQSLLGNRQRVCRAVATVLRSPWLTHAIIRILALAPIFAAPLTSYLGERKVTPPRRRLALPGRSV